MTPIEIAFAHFAKQQAEGTLHDPLDFVDPNAPWAADDYPLLDRADIELRAAINGFDIPYCRRGQDWPSGEVRYWEGPRPLITRGQYGYQYAYGAKIDGVYEMFMYSDSGSYRGPPPPPPNDAWVKSMRKYFEFYRRWYKHGEEGGYTPTDADLEWAASL